MSENTNEGCGEMLGGIIFLAIVILGTFFGTRACGKTSPTPTPTPRCRAGASERTEDCDEFIVRAPIVEKDGDVWTDDGWYPLYDGETLAVDSEGEAEVNFSACWPGHMYVFQKSDGKFRVNRCGKFASESGSLWCLSGFWYVSCQGEYTLLTGSAQIKKQGTTLYVMSLPEMDNLTLVTVLEGEVEIRPVESYPSTLGPAATVTAGEFYFTMPDAQLHEIDGLAPRTALSHAELGNIMKAMPDIEPWFEFAAEKAEIEDIPAPSLNPSYRSPGFGISSVGGVFEEPDFQRAALWAVDWSQAAFAGENVVARIGDEDVDVLADLVYDPASATAFLEERGYESLPNLIIFYEEGEDELAEVAELAADYLRDNGFAENVEVAERTPNYLGAEPAIFLMRIR